MRFVIPLGRSRVVVGLFGLVCLAPVALFYWLIVGCVLVVVAVVRAEVWAVRFVVRRWRESRRSRE
jgi:hypothetical protein